MQFIWCEKYKFARLKQTTLDKNMLLNVLWLYITWNNLERK